MAFPIKKVNKPTDLRGQSNGNLSPHLMKEIEPFGRMHHLAADAWNAMFDHAARDGVYLSNVGNYRSYDQQYALFMQRYVKNGPPGGVTRRFQGAVWTLKPKMAPAATPGKSNHGWGLAIDACLITNGKKVSITNQVPGKRFSGAAWLLEHAHKYGFSWELQSEPWHIRYVSGDNIPQAVRNYLISNPEAVSTPNPPTPTSPNVTIVTADPPWPGGSMLRLGMRNSSAVREVQSKLGLKIDGWYGKQTRAAVMDFQRSNPECGPVDGIVGPKTWGVMFKKAGPVYPGYTIKIGLRNDENVRLVQKKLGILADGWFGRQTKKAVMDFQKSHPESGPADGIVGPRTWAVLFK